MPDFDPINLGKYVPRGMVELRDAYEVIVDAFAYMKMTIVGDMTLADYEKTYGSESAKLLSSFYTGLPSELALQMQCWELLRHELVTGYVKAYVVDMSGAVNAIEHSFWVTDFAKVAFSTGELPSTPSFPHGGVVVVMYADHKKLFGKYFEYFVNQHWVEADDRYITGVRGVRLDVPGPHDNIPKSDDHIPEDGSGSKRGGRPVLYDVEQFLSQAFALIQDECNPPATQAALARRAADVYERANGRGGRPSTPWAKAQVRSLWAAMRADKKG